MELSSVAQTRGKRRDGLAVLAGRGVRPGAAIGGAVLGPLAGGASLAAVALAAVMAGGSAPVLLGGIAAAASGALLLALTGRLGSEAPDAADRAGDAAPSDAVRVHLDENGDVGDVGENARLLLGLAPELLLGSGLFDRLHVTDRVLFMRALSDMRHGAARRRLDLRIRLPREVAGEPDSFRGISLELQPDGGSGALAGFLRDNSDTEALRTALRDAEARVGEADRQRERLLAGVAHELRTPLNAIIGFSDMLGRDGVCPLVDPRQKEYLDLIRQSGEHLLSVVEAMVHASMLEAGAAALELRPLAVSDAVEACRAMVAMAAEAKAVTVRVSVAPSCGAVLADRRTVQQILLNLLSNAVKFTPPGGSVTVEARRAGSRLLLSVSDTGVGIAPADLDRLGAPFVRVGAGAGRADGCGLGLSLAKKLAALHGGTLAIQSAPGEGTVATVSLPAEPVAAAPPGRAADDPRGEWDGARRKTA